LVSFLQIYRLAIHFLKIDIFRYRMSDKMIKKLYPKMDIKYIDNQRIIFSKNLKSKAVLFIHGSPGSSAQFLVTSIPKYLIESNVAIIFIDRIGYGYSEYKKTELSIEFVGNKIANCLKYFFQVKNLIIVGYSYGGPIAAFVSTVTQIHVNSLILISASVKPNAEKIYWFNYLLKNRVFENYLPHNWIYANNEKLNHCESLKKINEIWIRIKTDIICIHGDKDTLIYPENAIYVKEKAILSRSTQILIIPGGRHNVLWNYSHQIKTLLINSFRL
jgi:pimeloyl-ACP methyl ester carboxylesterase